MGEGEGGSGRGFQLGWHSGTAGNWSDRAFPCGIGRTLAPRRNFIEIGMYYLQPAP